MERRSGNTTRLIDMYVQELFTKGTTDLIDHYDGKIAHKMLVRTFQQRMANEHPGTKIEYKLIKDGAHKAILK